MAFKPIKYDSGRVYRVKQNASTTVTKHNGLTFSSGYAQRATSSDAYVKCVSLEGQVNAAATYDEIDVIDTQGVLFECDTNSSTSQALIGTFIDLTDHDTLNEAASSTNAFLVTELVGATTDQKVRGYFMQNVS